MNEEVRYIGIGLNPIAVLLIGMIVSVADTCLDPKSYGMLAKLSIKPYVKVFMNTVAVIATEGIMGRVDMCDYEPI